SQDAQNACQQSLAGAGAANAQDMSQATAAETKVLEDLQDIAVTTGVVAGDIQQIYIDQQRSKDAQNAANLALAVQQSGLQTLNGEYVALNNYAADTAGAQLDLARKYAVLARRSLEATYLMSLDSVTTPLPLVAAPSTWADSVYSYDLSMAQTIGGQVV